MIIFKYNMYTVEINENVYMDFEERKKGSVSRKESKRQNEGQ